MKLTTIRNAIATTLFVPLVASAQAPSTDIGLVEISDGKVDLARFVRVTDRPSYDNQPSFLPDGSLAYTAMQEDGSTNVHRYDVASGEANPLTSTPESEYSATPVPGRDEVSVIRDFGNLKQELWAYSTTDPNAEPRLLLPDVNPVGYHAWVDDTSLLLFVLGEPQTLQVAVVGPGAGDIVGQSPGRSLARIPGTAAMSFVSKASETEWPLTTFNPSTGEKVTLVNMPSGSEDLAWSPAGVAWTGVGSKLYTWTAGASDWEEAADLEALGIRNITRLSFDTDGSTLALVFERAAGE
ncbi:MAG: hypothetical protein AAF690_28200 [Acidobacteriota bacterium]